MLIYDAAATTSSFEQVSIKLRQMMLPPERGMRVLFSLLSRSIIQKSPTAAECVVNYKILNYKVLTERQPLQQSMALSR